MRKTNDFDHDWNDVTIFEKLPVRKVAKKAKKHDDGWKQKRKALRRAKQILQEITHA
tara:strand:- start:75 stop:245 length:171 start_codon:yes stop_codon:yes gene_type:complete